LTGSSISFTRRTVTASARPPDSVENRRLDAAIAAVLVLAVLLQGIREALDLPGALELLADLSAGALLLWIAWAVIRSRRPVIVPYLAIAIALALLASAATADDLPRMLVSAKNFLFLPVLALAIAALGPSENRVRVVVLTALALAVVQFAVTIVQSFQTGDVDLITGTFGDYAGPSTALALEVGACLALGLFASTGRPVWLAVGVVLPLAAIWTVLRLMLLVVPIAGLAVAAAAWWTGRNQRGDAGRRALAIAAAVVVSSAMMVGGYAIWKPSDLGVLTDAESRDVYLEEADIVAKDPARKQTGAVEVPGRREQVETAMRLVSENPGTLLIGLGLGATTYAENLDIEIPADRDLVVAGYMDAGTLLVETGWAGVALVVASALALMLGALGAGRRSPPSTVMRALLIAYPGILVAIGAGAIHGSPFRNLGSATIVWVLTGLVLASVLQASRSSVEARPRS
jgi:hypothetical protein